MANNPFQELVSVLDVRMKGHASDLIDGVPAEMGTITNSGLKLDNFKHEIQDYLVADWLVKLHLPSFSLTGTVTGLSAGSTNVTGTGTFTFQPSQLDDVRLNLKAGLNNGDRVLAIPINSGKDAIVISKVLNNG